MMSTTEILSSMGILFVLGIVLGSFCAARVVCLLSGQPQGIWGRSRCMACRHVLAWKELIPLLSFLFLKGQCGHCGKKFTSLYFFIEILVGILAMGGVFFLFPGFSGTALLHVALYLLFICVGISIACIDWQIQAFPVTWLQISGFVFLLSALVFRTPTDLSSSLIGALCGALLFFLLRILASWILKKEALGAGDISLAFFLGAFLGWENLIVAFYLGVFLALLSLPFFWFTKKRLPSILPFAPFLVGGGIMSIFVGGQILSYYYGLFL